MKIYILALALLVSAGCSRDHIRNYPLNKFAPVYIQDIEGGIISIDIGSRHVVRGDRSTLVIVREIREERYPLLRGWHIEREDDTVSIEEIPTFDPF